MGDVCEAAFYMHELIITSLINNFNTRELVNLLDFFNIP